MYSFERQNAVKKKEMWLGNHGRFDFEESMYVQMWIRMKW